MQRRQAIAWDTKTLLISIATTSATSVSPRRGMWNDCASWSRRKKSCRSRLRRSDSAKPQTATEFVRRTSIYGRPNRLLLPDWIPRPFDREHSLQRDRCPLPRVRVDADFVYNVPIHQVLQHPAEVREVDA